MLKSLALLAAVLPSSAFGAVLINDSFDYGLPDGTVVNNGTVAAWGNAFSTPGAQFSTTDFDGTGGSVFLSSTNDGPYLRLTNPNTTGAPVAFELTLSMPATGVPSGARVMFETVAATSTSGFGINFDIKLDSTDNQRYFDIYPRVGGTHGAAPGQWLSLIKQQTVRIYGTYARIDATTGTVTINYDDGVTVQTATRSAAFGTLGNDIGFRTATSRQYYIDGVRAETIPEPTAVGLIAVCGLLLGRPRR